MNKTLARVLKNAIDRTNDRNRSAVCPRERRIGWNCALEAMLMDAGVYHGFGYLWPGTVPQGEPPGAQYDSAGKTISHPDDSRVFYNIHPKIERALEKGAREEAPA